MEPSTSQSEKTGALPASPAPPNGEGGHWRKWPRRRFMITGATGLLLIGLVLGGLYFRHAMAHESTADAFIDGHIIAISPRVDGHVERVLVNDNQKVAAGDLLVELDSRDFRVRLNAAKAALDAAEAGRQAQDIGINVTSITTTAGLAEAKANVAAAKAMVANAQSLSATAASQVDQARAYVSVAKSALAQDMAEIDAKKAKSREAAQDLKRYQELARSDIATPQQLDHAVATARMAAADLSAAQSKVATQQAMVRQAEAALKAATDGLDQARSQVAARQAELDQANARLASARSAPDVVSRSTSQAAVSKADAEKARADVEQAALNLSYTKIHAPADGHVTKKAVEPGTFVQIGQSLMAIVPREVWVTANFKETQLTHMRPGQPVTIKADTYPDKTFHGRVDSIQRGTGSRFSLLPPENATGNFVKVVQRIPVKIVFDRPAELSAFLLVPGMSVVPVVDITAGGQPPSAPPPGQAAGSPASTAP
ncbi:HlyD family secretion protein [Desulfosarcina cetonica]|uniref:HlyD family secretion protein n=1 Tax=Desulfosarcina cetonica TaxID=90730 RepID=UPI00155DB089|nr:HlyD family secretion protein [Desulfosarcina cetonica]